MNRHAQHDWYFEINLIKVLTRYKVSSDSRRTRLIFIRNLIGREKRENGEGLRLAEAHLPSCLRTVHISSISDFIMEPASTLADSAATPPIVNITEPAIVNTQESSESVLNVSGSSDIITSSITDSSNLPPEFQVKQVSFNVTSPGLETARHETGKFYFNTFVDPGEDCLFEQYVIMNGKEFDFLGLN